MTPISSGYYICYDGRKIYVIEQAGIDALLSLLHACPFPAAATPLRKTESENTLLIEIASQHPGFFQGIDFQPKREYSV
jgi:hypothetical protein